MATFNFGVRNKEVEWVDLAIMVGGSVLTKFQGIKYKPAKDKQALMADGDKPIGIQSGNRSYSGELKLLKGPVDILNAAAVAAGGDDLLDLEVDIVVTWKKRGIRPLNIDTLIGVQFTEYEKGMEQGAKSMPISLPFIYLDQK